MSEDEQQEGAGGVEEVAGVEAEAEVGSQPKGKAIGGFARAAALPPAVRSEIASNAAKARWEKATDPSADLPRVLPGYSAVLNLAGRRLPCAVIQTKEGVLRVLTEHGITSAILGSRSGASKRLKKAASQDGALLPIFLAPGQLNPFVLSELVDGPLVPIDYVDGDRVVRAYDAAILPAVCNVWLRAREAGALQKQQLAKAQRAEILMRALAETGIVALIDEVTGYELIRPQNALQAYIEKVIAKELAAWAKRFPDEFYENIYRLRGWPWPGMKKNRFSAVAHYTRDLVYERIGPSVLEELEKKSPRNEKGQRPNKLHQWLTTDIGIPMLSQHLHALVMLQRLALANNYGWTRFVRMVDQVLPKRGTNLDLPFGDPIAPLPPSEQPPSSPPESASPPEPSRP
jgi:hypothetical protein